MQPSELIWVQGMTIVLGLLVAMPLIALTVWLTRRTKLPPRALPFAVALGILAFLVASRLNTTIVGLTGLDSPAPATFP